jgi:hypothetical protein
MGVSCGRAPLGWFSLGMRLASHCAESSRTLLASHGSGASGSVVLSGGHLKSQKLVVPLFALLALGHCLAFIDRNLPSAAVPLLKADRSVSDAQLGLLDGLAFVLCVIGMLGGWPYARSRHRFRVLVMERVG